MSRDDYWSTCESVTPSNGREFQQALRLNFALPKTGLPGKKASSVSCGRLAIRLAQRVLPVPTRSKIMTGTIAVFNNVSSSGLISTDDGQRIHFDSTGVLAYDIVNLAVGRLVTFDLLPGRNPEANNVCVERLRVPGSKVGCHEALPLRYMGFEQSGSVRVYRFVRTQLGEARATVVVKADLALFTKHHVGIQEGPNLCLHLLAAALVAGVALAPPPYALTDTEMLFYLANRPVPAKRSGTKQAQTYSVAAPFLPDATPHALKMSN